MSGALRPVTICHGMLHAGVWECGQIEELAELEELAASIIMEARQARKRETDWKKAEEDNCFVLFRRNCKN